LYWTLKYLLTDVGRLALDLLLALGPQEGEVLGLLEEGE